MENSEYRSSGGPFGLRGPVSCFPGAQPLSAGVLPYHMSFCWKLPMMYFPSVTLWYLP